MAKKDKKKEDETKKVVAKCDTPDEVVATQTLTAREWTKWLPLGNTTTPSCYKKQVSDGSRRQTISQ